MLFHFTESRNGFTLIELIVVMLILVIIASIIVPIIIKFLETANQTTDNANARLIYNATAMWYSKNNVPDENLSPAELSEYLGVPDFPKPVSQSFSGVFSASVTSDGEIIVLTTKPAKYNPSIGKLES